MKLLPSWRILCTPYNHASCHFMQSHIHMVHMCLAVTCHLHFWLNDWDLLGATVVAWGWNGEENSLTAPVGIRTCNLSITSPALKPLSCPHFLTTELSPSVSSSRAFCNCLLFFPFFFFAVDILVGLTGLMPSCLRRGTGRDRGQFLKRKESWSRIKLRSFCLPA